MSESENKSSDTSISSSNSSSEEKSTSSVSSPTSEDASDASEDLFFDAISDPGATLTRSAAEGMEQVLKFSTPRPSLSIIKPRLKSKSKSPNPNTASFSGSKDDGGPESPRLGLSPISDKKLRNESIGDDILVEEHNRRKRMEDMRRRLNTDEVYDDNSTTCIQQQQQGIGGGEDCTVGGGGASNSPGSSRNSSVEGFYGGSISTTKSSVSGTSHPFKVVDHDSISLQSGISSSRPLVRNSSAPCYPIISNSSISTAGTTPGSTSTSTITTNNPSISSTLPITAAMYSSDSGGDSSNNFLPHAVRTAQQLQQQQEEQKQQNIHTKVAEPDLVASCMKKTMVDHHGFVEQSSPIFTFTPPPVPPPRNRKKRTGIHSVIPILPNLAQSPVVSPLAEVSNSNIGTPIMASSTIEREKLVGTSMPSLPTMPLSIVNQYGDLSREQREQMHFICSPNPPSPTISIRSVAKELDLKALDQVINAQRSSVFVVKAQDEEKTRARNSGPRTLRRTESLPQDVMDSVDLSILSGGGGSIHSKSESNSNSSTLGEGAAGAGGTTTNNNPTGSGSIPNSSGSNKSNSIKSRGSLCGEVSINTKPSARNSHISSFISAIADFEERKDAANATISANLNANNVLSVSSSAGAGDINSGGSGQITVYSSCAQPSNAGGIIIGFGGGGSGSGNSKDNQSQMNMYLRTKTDSGKLLSDLEILEQVTVLNLDTGERVPLSSAEDKLPRCINPLSLHIMRLTSEYVSEIEGKNKLRDSDEESISSSKISSIPSNEDDGESVGGSKRKTAAHIKRFLGTTVGKAKRTMGRAKQFASQYRKDKEDVDIGSNEGVPGQDSSTIKIKASHSHKGPYDFDHLVEIQDLTSENGDAGPVWCMKFSNCGRLLATAGQDKCIRIWVLKDHLQFFQDIRSKHTGDKVSPTPSQESVMSQHSRQSSTTNEDMLQASEKSDSRSPFVPKPFCIYSGHQADLLDMAWSKSFFLLSSSMDRTVRLWHISRRECLCCFQHIDFVTAIAFHPRDDRYFLSGSLDGKLRLWNIPDKKVALWNEVNGPNKLITAANFCQNGKFAVIGTYDGRCIFYHTEQLKYHTQINVHSKKRVTGRKITGIEPMPGEDKLLVTSNDSRIRLYDLRDLSLTCKYKGYVNLSSQIKASFSQDGKYIVSGSENQFVYIWKTFHDYSKFSSARRDRNRYWQGVKAHNALTTSAIFAPDPDLIVRQIDEAENSEAAGDTHHTTATTPVGFSGSTSKSGSIKSSGSGGSGGSPYSTLGYVLVSADFSGCIKVFLNRTKAKHSSLPASALV